MPLYDFFEKDETGRYSHKHVARLHFRDVNGAVAHCIKYNYKFQTAETTDMRSESEPVGAKPVKAEPAGEETKNELYMGAIS